MDGYFPNLREVAFVTIRPHQGAILAVPELLHDDNAGHACMCSLPAFLGIGEKLEGEPTHPRVRRCHLKMNSSLHKIR